MRPRESSNTDLQDDLFKVELDAIIDPDHSLVRLAGQIDWAFFERQRGAQFCETNGAPAKPVRLMVGLHYLKQTFNLSDEQKNSCKKQIFVLFVLLRLYMLNVLLGVV
jgi:IS5 family transposase